MSGDPPCGDHTPLRLLWTVDALLSGGKGRVRCTSGAPPKASPFLLVLTPLPWAAAEGLKVMAPCGCTAPGSGLGSGWQRAQGEACEGSTRGAPPCARRRRHATAMAYAIAPYPVCDTNRYLTHGFELQSKHGTGNILFKDPRVKGLHGRIA